MPLNILLIGARGRMGAAITAAAPKLSATIVAGINSSDDPAPHVAACDAIIDFSSHAVTAKIVALAVRHKKPLVIGTTGHSAEEKKQLLAEAAAVPCVWSGNYSVGVNLLFALTQRATRVLGLDYDAEVVEMHHRLKKDAPSGTAARLLEIILAERNLTSEALRHGREGIVGARTQSEVGIHSIRGGDVVGDHTVMFAGLGERVELTHKASDRGIYARGSLRAAEWLQTQAPGIYDMQDVLGLKA